MHRPTLHGAARTALADAHAERRRALLALSTAALDARDGLDGADADLQHALRFLERATVARRRAAVAHRVDTPSRRVA